MADEHLVIVHTAVVGARLLACDGAARNLVVGLHAPEGVVRPRAAVAGAARRIEDALTCT